MQVKADSSINHMEQKKYIPYVKPLPEKARKVRGGLRVSQTSWPLKLSWAPSRWVEMVTRSATPEVVQQGYEYGRLGQVRTLAVEPGKITGEVQGRQYRPHRAVLEFRKFTDEQWHAVETTMTDQAVYAAKLLAHEVPDTIEGAFEPLGLKLFPVAGSQAIGAMPATPDLAATCTCGHAELPQGWCKHLVCTALLIAEMMEKNPFLIFTLRGLPGDELIERLRQRRAAAAGGDMFTQSLAQRLGGLTDSGALGASGGSSPGSGDSLESHLDDFWDMGPGLDDLETPIRKPEVNHVLLRRLGPSPFKDGKFPLVGLLATCYETISKAAIEGMSAAAPGAKGESDQST